MQTQTRSKVHTPQWQGFPRSTTTLASLQLALGELPTHLPPISVQPFAFVRVGFCAPSLPRATVVQPALQKVLLSPTALAGPRITNLTASSHKCPWAESDLENEMPVKSGNSWKRPFSLLSAPVKWHLFLDRLQTLKTVVATFKNSPGERLNLSLTSSKL